MNNPKTIDIVVLISGSGSNLQALIDGQQDGSLPIHIVAVISNKQGVKGIERATEHNIPTHIINHKDYDSRESFDHALKNHIDQYSPQLVVLAGFMRILSAPFTSHFAGKMLNIHPSLLPKYTGLNTHKRAIEAGDTTHGVTVHFVTAELDGGPAIVQAIVPITKEDNETSLAAKVLKEEHYIYPLAVKWFATNRLSMRNGQVYFDAKALGSRGIQIDRYKLKI